jgi:hypothetical protein
LPRSLSAINKIIIHCSATPNGRDHDALDVNFWHGHDRVKRGLKPFRRQESFRKDFNPDMDHIGYHYVIRLDGSVESGRALWEVGAHAQGQNSGSVGICMIGTDQFTSAQFDALKCLVTTLTYSIPSIKSVIGHHQVAEHKTCPGFSVPAWERNHYTPEPENLLRDCNEPNLNHANNHAKN